MLKLDYTKLTHGIYRFYHRMMPQASQPPRARPRRSCSSHGNVHRSKKARFRHPQTCPRSYRSSPIPEPLTPSQSLPPTRNTPPQQSSASSWSPQRSPRSARDSAEHGLGSDADDVIPDEAPQDGKLKIERPPTPDPVALSQNGGVSAGVDVPTTQPSLTADASSLPPTPPRKRFPPDGEAVVFEGVVVVVVVVVEEDCFASCANILSFTGRSR